MVAGLIDSEADFAFEYLGHDLAAFLSCFEVVLARVIVTRVFRTSLVLSLSLLVIRLRFSLLTGILHSWFALICRVGSCLLLTLRLFRHLLASLILGLVNVTSVVDMLSECAIISEGLATDFTYTLLSVTSVKLVTLEGNLASREIFAACVTASRFHIVDLLQCSLTL